MTHNQIVNKALDALKHESKPKQPWFSEYEYTGIMESLTRNDDLKCYVLNTSQFPRWARQACAPDSPFRAVSARRLAL